MLFWCDKRLCSESLSAVPYFKGCKAPQQLMKIFLFPFNSENYCKLGLLMGKHWTVCRGPVKLGQEPDNLPLTIRSNTDHALPSCRCYLARGRAVPPLRMILPLALPDWVFFGGGGIPYLPTWPGEGRGYTGLKNYLPHPSYVVGRKMAAKGFHISHFLASNLWTNYWIPFCPGV